MTEIIDPTKYKKSDSYLGNKAIRAADSTPTQYTPEMIEEIKRCKEDIVYFCSKYIKIINLDRGLINFVPYPYQEEMWKSFEENRYNCCLLARQLGKSTGVVGYLLWFSLFHTESNVAIVAHKLKQARELLSRYKLALENLPFFLQPGCKTYNKTEIEFITNSKVFAASSESSSLRGESLSLVYIDEMGFIENAEDFMTATFPVIASSKKAKIIMTSSASAVGTEFHRVVEEARKNKNEFNLIEYDWRANPERDEEWKQSQIANTSEFRFKVEHENAFLGGGSTLISGDALSKLDSESPEMFKYDNMLRIYEKPVVGKNYAMTVDVSKGIGKDRSTFTVFDITDYPYRQVATFISDAISPLLFPSYIHNTAKAYNTCVVVVESNDQGIIVCNTLHYDYEYEELFNESFTKASGLGVYVDKKVKSSGCITLKEMIDGHQLELVDEDTIFELRTFEQKGSSYEASNNNHDDLVSNLWLFAWFTQNPIFDDYTKTGSLKDALYSQEIEEIDKDPFIGVFDNGIDYSSDYL